MKILPARFCLWLQPRLLKIGRMRPYFHLQGYMSRWWLIGGSFRDERIGRGWDAGRFDRWIGRWIAFRLHCIHRSDEDRHMHDHPAWSISIILANGYTEVMPRWKDQHPIRDATSRIIREARPGQIIFRRASDRHRIIISPGRPCWTIFILGRSRQDWGFYTDHGKIGWREYLGLKGAK